MNNLPHPASLIDLSGKVAVVTGAGKGIGAGCARVLGAAGAAVAVLDIDSEAAAQSAAALQRGGVRARAYAVDVGSARAVDEAITSIASELERIDIVVNNAGTHDSKSVEQASEADWDRIIDTNLKSVFLVIKATLPYLKQTRGSIVNMGSMVGLVGQGSAGAYSASKGGIVAMTKNLALDLAPYGIRVNCICPGWVETPLVNAWFALQPDLQQAQNYVNSIHPLGRIASPEEIGQVALFLSSPLSSFVTGVAMPVDGGVTLGY